MVTQPYPSRKPSTSALRLALVVVCAVLLFLPMHSLRAATATLTMQDASFPTQVNNGGDFYNNGATELGMWANTASTAKQTAGWGNFTTSGFAGSGGSARSLQVGDQFTITVSATRAFGQIGFSLNSGGTQGTSYANNISGSRLYVNTDNYGSWYVGGLSGGATSSFSYTPSQNTRRDYQFRVFITSNTTAYVELWVDGVQQNTANNLTLGGSGGANIGALSIYGSDMWDGDSNDDAYWKQTSTIVDNGFVNLGYALASGTFDPGGVNDGLAANSTSTTRANSVNIGGNSGSAVLMNEANGYTGATVINAAATARLSNATGFGTTAGGVSVTSGGVIEISGGITVGNEALTLNGDGISAAGALRNTSGDNIWQGAVTVNTSSRINSDSGNLTLSGAVGAGTNTLFVGGAGNTTISGAITGSNSTGNGALFKDGTGTLTLSAVNNSTLTGLMLINGGTVSVANNGNLTSGTIQLGSGATTATLSITGGDTVRTQGIAIADSSTAGVINITSGTTYMNGTLSQAGGSANTTKFGKSGAGTLYLGSANSYQGQIQIGQGDVILANNTASGTNNSTANRGIDLGLNVGDVSQASNVGLYVLNGVTSNASIYVAPNTTSATRTIGLSGSGSGGFSNEIYIDQGVNLTGGSGTATFSGNMTGNLTNSPTVRITGGTVAFTHNSTGGYNGTTFIDSGATLQLGAAGTSGWVGNTSGITNNGTLRYDRTNNVSTSLIISGSGALTKNGSGTLTLSGANSYTGATTINAGTLALGADNVLGDSSAVTVAGGSLDVGTRTEAIHSLTLTSGSLAIGSGNLTVNNASSITGGTIIMSSQGGRMNSTGTLTLGSSSFNYTSTSGSDTTNALNLGGDIAVNASTTFNFLDSGGAAGNPRINLNNAARVFDVGSGANLNVNWDIWSSTPSSGALTKNGTGTLTLNGTGSYTGTTTINDGTLVLGHATDTIASSGAITINGGNLSIGSNSDTVGTVTLAGGNITGSTGVLTGSSYALQSGNITAILGGTGAATKTTAGTVILSGANTYTGATIINAGTLSISSIGNGGAASNIGQSTSAAGNLTLGGGELAYTGSTASTDRNFTLTAATTSTINVTQSGTSLTISGTAASTSGALTKNGSGTLILSGANAYTGATAINAGVLRASNNTALGTTAGGVTVASGAALELTGGISIGAEALSLSGDGISSGGGLRNITGDNSYAGAITLGAASRINSDAGTLTLTGGISGAQNLTFGGAGNTTVSTAAISNGAGTLTKDGAGTLTISSTGNTWNGTTTVSAGTLTLSGSLTSNASVAVRSASGAVLNITGNFNQTSPSNARGFQLGQSAGTSGTVNVSGSGILNIAGMMLGDNGGGNGTFNVSGGTVTNSSETWFAGANSTFNVSGGSYTATSGWTYIGGGSGTNTSTLTVNGTGTYTASTIDFGRGSANAATIINLGDGTAGGNLSVNGFNYVQGPSHTINFNGGTLNVRSSISMITQATTVVKSGGAIIDVNSGQTFTLSNNLTDGTGGGGLTKNGTGTLTLSGTNSYTGTSILNAGQLNINSATALGTGAFTINGGTIDNTSAGAITLSNNNAQNWSSNFTFTGTKDLNMGTGAVAMNADRTVTVSGGNLTVGGAISGVGFGLTKNGTGSLFLSGASGYTGATTINAGALRASNATALGTTAAGTTVASGAALELSGGITVGAEALALSGTGISSGGGLRNITGDNSYAGAITLGAASRINSDAGNLTLTGGISGAQNLTFGGSGNTTVSTAAISTGAGTFTKDGSGNLTISSAGNTWNGTTTVSAGTLTLSGSLTSNANVFVGSASGGVLNVTGNLTQTKAANPRNFQITNGSGQAGTVNVSGSGIINSTGLFLGDNGGGNATLNISGGTFTNSSEAWLAGSNNIVSVSGGTFNNTANNFEFGGGIANGISTVTVNGTGAMNLATIVWARQTSSSTTLNLGDGSAGGNLSISGISWQGGSNTINFNGGTLTTSGAITISSANAATVVKSGGAFFNVASNTLAISGNLTDGTGGGGLTKNGTGTLTLSGTNTYTGTTTINMGTLRLGGGSSSTIAGNIAIAGGELNYSNTTNEQIANTSNVTLSSGTFALAARTETINAMSMSGGNLTIGGGTFAVSAASSFTGGNVVISSAGGNITTSGTTTLGTANFIYDNGATAATDGLVLGGNIAVQSSTTANFTNTGSGAGRISLNGGNRTFDVGSSGNLNVNWVIAGTGNLTKSGAGTMTLNATNTFTGNTTVTGGTLATSGANQLSTTSTLDVQGGTFQLGGNQAFASIQGAGNITLGANTLTAGSNNANTVLSGNITGSGGALTKNGTGTLTLSGTNTYSGATTINAGTLTISGNTSSSAITIASGATLNASGTAGTTIVNSGGTLMGSGTAGTTTVNGIISPGNSPGILTVGDLTLNSGGTYVWEMADATGAAGTGWDQIVSTGLLTVASTSGATFTINITSTGSPTNWSKTTGYTWDIIDYGTISGFAANKFTLNTANFAGSTDAGSSWALSDTGSVLRLTYSYTSGTPTWSGGSANWSAGFTPAIANGLNAVFDGAGGGTATNNIAAATLANIGSLTFNSTAGAYTLAANSGSSGFDAASALAIGGNITNSSTATQTLNIATSFAASQTVTANTGNIAIGGALSVANAQTLTLAGNITISGNTSGAGSLSKTGTGTLTLSGSSSLSGGVAASAGTLLLGHNNALGTGNFTTTGDVTIASTDSTARVLETSYTSLSGSSVTVTFGQASGGTGSLTFNGTGGLAIGSGNRTLQVLNTTTLMGGITGTGDINKTGAGTLVLSGNNTYSGLTTIGAGTLEIGATGRLGGGTYSSNISNSGTFIFGSNSNQTLSGIISGSGGLTKNGSGNLTLSGANTYTGATTVNAGTLKLGGGNERLADGTSLVINSGGTFDLAGFSETIAGLSGSGSLILASAGQLTIGTMAADTTFSGLISGSGQLNKVGGSGKFITLTNDSNSFTGNISIANGGTGFYVTTIGNIGQNSAAGAGERIIWNSNPQFWYIGTTNSSSNRTLEFTGANSGLLGNSGTGTVSFTGNFVNTGSGAKIFFLDGNNTGSNLLGVNLVDNGSSTLNLTKQGTGKWIVSGNNTNTGGTSLKDGELSLGHKNALGTGTLSYENTTGTPSTILTANTNLTGANAVSNNITLSAAGTKTIGGSNDLELSGIISGSSIGFTKNGTATLILSGANTYTGATTITAGTLQIGGGGTTGSLSTSSAITNNANLAFNRTNTLTQGTDFNSVISGTGNVTQAGTGTTVLNGTNTYTGATTITAGTLSIAAITNGSVAGALGNSTTAAGNLVLSGGELAYTGSNGSTNRNFTLTAGTSSTINVTQSATSLTLSGTAANTNGSLTKAGSGTLILSGANAYTGATTINAGTLNAAASGALGSTPSVTVNNGGSLLVSANGSVADTTSISLAGGRLALGGTVGEVVGALTLTSNSVVDMGSGAAWISFDSLTSVLTSTTQLQIWNYTPGSDAVYFRNSANVQSSLGFISFYSGAGTGTFFNALNTASFSPPELYPTPVPEPETYATALLLLLGIGIYSRREFKRRRRAN